MNRTDDAIAFVVVSDLYDVRPNGEVFSRISPQGHVTSEWRKVSRLCKHRDRYMMTAKSVQIKVSRVIYWKFKGPIPEGMFVDHINEIRTDDRIENLQLLTNKENAAKTNRANPRLLALRVEDRCHNVKLTESDVRKIRSERAAGATLGQLARQFRIGKGHASEICSCKIWKHIS